MRANMHISNDKLIGTNVAHPKGKTQHGGRILPTVIVVHETASPTSVGHSTRFILGGGGRAKASYHAIFEREKRLVNQLVDFDRKAHHAGPSTFKGRKGVNGFSIGLALASPGLMRRIKDKCHLFYGPRSVASYPATDCEQHPTRKSRRMAWWLPYADHQLADLKETCRLLIEQYPSIKDITTHEMIDDRGWKSDAGPLFPLEQWRVELFAGKKVGDGMLRVGDSGRAVNRAITHLYALGYWSGSLEDDNFGPLTKAAVMSFQSENGLDIDGVIGPKTWAALEREDAKPFPTGAREESGKIGFNATKSSTKETAEAVELTTGLSIAGGLASVTDTAKLATAWQEPLEALKGFADFMATGLIPFVFSQWKIIGFFVVMLAGFFMARRIRNLRFQDWLSYKHVGK